MPALRVQTMAPKQIDSSFVHGIRQSAGFNHYADLFSRSSSFCLVTLSIIERSVKCARLNHVYFTVEIKKPRYFLRDSHKKSSDSLILLGLGLFGISATFPLLSPEKKTTIFESMKKLGLAILSSTKRPTECARLDHDQFADERKMNQRPCN